MAAAVAELSALTIFEKDDDEFLCAWVYPSIETKFKTLLLAKCATISTDHPDTSFCYSQFNGRWYYVHALKSAEQRFNEKVNEVYIVLIAQNFNPELYEKIVTEFSKSYAKAGTTPLLKQYLSMMTKGCCACADSSMIMASNFPVHKAYAQTCVKEMISLFGMEVILIYVAVLLKKRIAVYAPKLQMLLDVCRSMPAFAVHRTNWNITHPFIDPFNKDEIDALKKYRTYVVGCTDASAQDKTDIYDLFINVGDGEIVINPDSREFFPMGKMHKDIAKYLVQCADDEDLADEDIIEELKQRTTNIINNLKSLDADHPDHPNITLDLLSLKKLSTSMTSFLFHLASAEGLVRV